LDFDVIIVGASTSGLYAAKLLAQAGKRVGVFERHQKISPARRTYIVTPKIHTFLREIPKALELYKTQVMAVETPKANVSIPLREPDLIIERNLLTQTLFSGAVEAGVQIFFGHRFVQFDVSSGLTELIFNCAEGTVKATANFVIGADGLKSHTAIAAGIPLPESVSIIQAEVKLPQGWDPSVTKVWFDVEDTRFFYWLIPESHENGVLGLAGDDFKHIRKMLEQFLETHRLKADRFQASQVAMHHPGYKPWGEFGNSAVFLIGDAAGQVKVTTVGGTVSGFWGAQAAVRSILDGTSYSQELRSLKRELDLHWYIRWLLEGLDNAGYDQLLKYITLSVQNFLGIHNRDQMVGNFWKLALKEPQLVLLGIKLVISRLHFRQRRSAEILSELGD